MSSADKADEHRRPVSNGIRSEGFAKRPCGPLAVARSGGKSDEARRRVRNQKLHARNEPRRVEIYELDGAVRDGAQFSRLPPEPALWLLGVTVAPLRSTVRFPQGRETLRD